MISQRVVIAVLILGFLGVAEGDVVRLKNGNKFVGIVVRQSSAEVEVQVMLGGRMTFPRAQIEGVEIADPKENGAIVEQWAQEAKAIREAIGQRASEENENGPPRALASSSARADAAETARLIGDGARKRSDTGNEVLATGEWRHRMTQHFIVFHQDPSAGKEVAASADHWLEKILYDLNTNREDISRQGKCEVFVLSDSKSWEKLIEKRPNLEHSRAFSIPEKMEVFIRASDEGHEDIIFAHELGHLVLSLFSKGCKLPLWVHEGFAMYESGEFRYGRNEFSAAVKNGRLLSIHELHDIRTYPSDKNTNLLFYLQSGKVVEYIITQHGRERFARFASRLAEGAALGDALRVSFQGVCGTEKGFQEAWLKYIAE